MRTAIVATLLACLACVSPGLAAENPKDGDIRDIKIGAPVSGLTMEGYGGLHCAGSDAPLERWTDYAICAPDAAGLREIGFGFVQTNAALAAANDRWNGTRIAGHPVFLTLKVDADGDVAAIHIDSDPSASPYLRKKAYLLGLRVRERYGEDGWSCQDRPRAEGESDIGGMFIHRVCEKTVGARQLVLETSLYRAAGQSGRQFESSTHLEIRAVGM